MKITISYKHSEQISPDEWDVYTKIIHVNEHDTFFDIYEKHFKNVWVGNVDVELHFNPEVTGD